MRVLGVTGSMQTGKQELQHVFEQHGFSFLDCNVVAESVRSSGSPHRSAYEALGLGSGILDNGKKTALYYQKVAHVDGLHGRVMALEFPLVVAGIRERLSALDGNVVVNWGYLSEILTEFALEHVFVFQTNRDVWIHRLRARAIEAGWQGDPPSDAQIIELARSIDMMPDPILERVATLMPTAHSVIDTSADDWGEANLRAVIAELGW